MTRSVDPSGIDRMLTDAAAMLGKFQAGNESPDAEPAEGTGEAANGMIQAKAGAPGRLTSLTLDPRVLRLDSATLAEELLAAVNAALADLQSQAAGAAGAADLSELSGQLKAMQENAGRQFAAFTNALADAQQRLAAQGGK